ncbi:MAG: hypothetical protein ACH37Z_05575 [Anaerolineae bacterium]|jgi:hypothetical protein|nr:hypothetical protein [Anaerolineae bacterium]HRA19920.1 hypothetical protein [Anaerolineae bacterium]
MRIAITVGAGLVLALVLGNSALARPALPADADQAAPPQLTAAQAQRQLATAPLSWPQLRAAARSARGQTRAPAAVRRQSSGPLGLNATYTWIIDNFDTSAVMDPLLWVQVRDLNDGGEEYFWNLSRCRPKSPSQSLWPFGGGVNGSQLACDAKYPNGVAASAIMLVNPKAQFDGATPGSLRMAFDVWFNLRDFQEAGIEADGLFVNLLIPPSDTNPELRRVTLLHRTGRFPDRYFDDPLEIDFLAAQNVYKPEEILNIFEQGEVFIEFLALTQRPTEGNPAPTTFESGMFIDDIRWVSDMAPSNAGGTPIVTVAPTTGASSTPQIGPSDTPRPSDTPSPTDTPGGDTPTPRPTVPTPTMRPPTNTPEVIRHWALLPWLTSN